jgi:predicted AAA+ superfamily ATPase
MDYFKKNKGYIITFNQTDLFTQDGKSIEVIPAWKWMSENSKH